MNEQIEYIDVEFIDSLKKRYQHVNPLVFQRSVERSKNKVELFEILEDIPKLPFIWNEKKRRWIVEKDLFQIKKIKLLK
jgi:hypothetical protein